MAIVLDLIVHLNSDGTLFAYNKDMTLNLIYTDVTSWSTLPTIRRLETMSSSERKGKPKSVNIKYIDYYFKNSDSGEITKLNNSHIPKLIQGIGIKEKV